MKAMILKGITNLDGNDKPLYFTEFKLQEPSDNQILIKVSTCGVCHTELDEIEGRTKPKFFPIVLGHQIVGTVEKKGAGVKKFNIGDRVGVAWIYSACGKCEFCKGGEENLCSEFRATGRDAHGGYAEHTLVSEDFAFKIPDGIEDFYASPLMCAGAIGYRSLRLTSLRNGDEIGLMGFGASGHIVIKLIKNLYDKSDIFVFARSKEERDFALKLGADWAGDIEEFSPKKLSAIIDTTPVWKPVVESLKNLKKGGRLVINAIRKEEIDKEYLLSIDYGKHLWLEKEVKSVANITRKDVTEFLNMAVEFNIKPDVTEYNLEDANQALIDIKFGKNVGAKVLRINS